MYFLLFPQIVENTVFLYPDNQRLLFQIVQVGDCLTHRELALMGICDIPFKQRWHDAAGGLRFFAEVQHKVTAVLMMLFQKIHPLMDADEGAAMGRQDQCAVRQFPELLQRIQEILQRVAIWAAGGNWHIGRNAWQQHIAGNQDTPVSTVKSGMFISMAEARDDLPRMSTYGDQITFPHQMISVWEDRTACLHCIAPLSESCQTDVIQTMTLEQCQHRRN